MSIPVQQIEKLRSELSSPDNAAAMPGKLMGKVVWAASFAGQEIARRRTWRLAPRANLDMSAPALRTCVISSNT